MWRTWRVLAPVVGGIGLLWTLIASAQSSTPGMLVDATDCSTNARGGLYQPCTDLDDGKGWLCKTPTLGGEPGACDSPAEWLATTGGAGSGGGGAGSLDTSTTNVTVSNTTTETPLYTFSLPGATLGTGQCVEMRLFGLVTNDAPGVLTIRGSYGTGVATLVTNPFAAASQPFRVSWFVCGHGIETQQETHLEVVSGEDGFDGGDPQVQFARANISIDSTVTQALTVTAQWTAAAATELVTKRYGTVLTTGIAIPPVVVTTFNSRSGTVIPALGDYPATIVANTPAGTIAATTTQAAINELDAEKQAFDPELASLADKTISTGTTVPTVNGAPVVGNCVKWAAGSVLDDQGAPCGSGGGGGLTSVGLTMPVEFTVTSSPLVTNGTLAVTKATQAANTVFKGPASGAAAAPTFALLADADIPDDITANLYCQLVGCTLTGNLVLSNLGLQLTPSDTNPSCAGGVYRIYSDQSENKLKKCMNGVVSDLDTNTGNGTITDWQTVLAVSQANSVQFGNGTQGWRFWGDVNGAHQESIVPQDIIANAPSTFKHDWQVNGTSAFQLSATGVLTGQAGGAVDFSLNSSTKPFAAAAGAAPTVEAVCAWDSTAHRVECGENGTNRTIAWTSELGGVSNDSVDNTKLANMTAPALKGRATTGAGDPEDLTPTQATAMLNTFSATLKGLVPPPTTATGKVLQDDGTWVVQTGGGGSGIGRTALSATWTSISDGSCQTQTATWTGVTTGDTVMVSPSSGLNNGLSLGAAFVSAANTIKLEICNHSGGDLNPGGQTMNAILATYTLAGSAALNFPSIEDGSCATPLTITLSGVAASDVVIQKLPSTLETGLAVTMKASATNTVSVQPCNHSGNAIDPASQTFAFQISK